jgi:predicted naringenin-chalcone synthase
MSSFIHHIETTVPGYSYKQDYLRDRLKEIVQGSDRENRMIHALFSRSGIETRHSVVNDFREHGSHTLFFNGQGTAPGTRTRNDTYIREGRKLFVDVAQNLIDNSDFQADEITHLITVSCTGFYAPGPDFDIIKSLGLNHSVERYHLGFMGCYAAIPAIKMADQICRANDQAVVMVVSVELCTIHFQANPSMDDLLSSTVFADGGSGALISNKDPKVNGFKIEGFASSLTDLGEEDMAWSIGDNGFNMVLSNYIPELLANGLEKFLKPVLNRFELNKDDIGLWAVHPGGRAILDKTEKILKLSENALNASRTVLSKYGNMSSATILFVLKEMLHSYNEPVNPQTLAMAFGPGLTLESALLKKV